MVAPGRLAVLACIGIALAAGGCATRPSQGVLIPVASAAEGASRVQVFAVTTRQRSTTDAGEMFNGERAGGTSYAAVTVSIPPNSARKIGEIQWPSSLPGDPDHDFARPFTIEHLASICR